MISRKSKYSLIIVFSAVVTSIVFVPLNFDALIIPKMAILFCMALYILPRTILGYRNILTNKTKILFSTLITLIIFQFILMLIFSGSILEQQVFGRTGRGLGFLTHVSLLIFLVAAATFIDRINFNLMIKGFFVSSLISGIYAILQKNNIDLFDWASKTNGVIGTLGNPNHQGVFAAMALVPSVVLLMNYRLKKFLVPISIIFSLYSIYIAQATQGYLSAAASVVAFSLIFLWFKNRIIFFAGIVFSSILSLMVILGTLNHGPFAEFLYKISVQSRGDFWRSAIGTANAHPLVGGGFDSFGDNYLIYRDVIAANHSFAEMTDNAHNYILEYAATGGYPLMLYHVLMIFLVIYIFISQMKKFEKFDSSFTAIFVAWLAFQVHTVVSPGNIGLMIWNSLFSGAIIGLNLNKAGTNFSMQPKQPAINWKIDMLSYSLLTVGVIVIAPLFNTDRLLLKGLSSTNATLVIEQVNKYPRSSVKFNLVGQTFVRSNLLAETLEVGRSATKFNPNAASGWALILINPLATIEERKIAKAQILRLDPLNKEVQQFKFD